MLRFQVLASGSNGNSSVLNTPKGTLLIDAGISCRRIIQGLSQLGIPPTDVQYILITHAHSDHVQGLPVLCDYLKAKVVATPETISEIRKLNYLDSRYTSVAENAISINFEKTKKLKHFEIISHETQHDISGASAFNIKYLPNDFTINYATDTVEVSSSMLEDMQNSDIIVLESNHNVSMLDKSRRPYFLKQRIKKTHLSNSKTIKILNKAITKKTKAVFLAHLSGECNKPELVGNKIAEHQLQYERDNIWEWVVCTRSDKSSLFQLNNGNCSISGGLSSLTFKEMYQNRNLNIFFGT